MAADVTTILTPVDGSEHAQRAAQVGAEMARRMGVPLVLFHALPIESIEILGMSSMSGDQLRNLATSSGKRLFDTLRGELGSELPEKIAEETTFGDPAEEIIRRCEGDSSILIVMGRRGLSRMQSLLLGSVSEKVLRHTKNPVLVLSA